MKERGILFKGRLVRAILDGSKTQTRRIVKPQPPSPEEVRKKAGIDYHLFTDNIMPNIWRIAGSVWAVRDLMGPDASKAPQWKCPYGIPRDRLWVRETWAPADFILKGYDLDTPEIIAYQADKTARTELGSIDTYAWNWNMMKWKPSIHMFRWASRIDLEITDIRVERIQDISEGDARAEGIDWAAPQFTQEQPDEHPHEVGYNRSGASFARDNFRRLWDSINAKRGFGWDANPWVWVITFRRIRP